MNYFLNPKLYSADIEKSATRNGFGDAMVELGAQNPNVVVVSADLAESMRLEKFEKAYPERFFEVGVAEQNMMGVAAGLALSGKIPFAVSYAVFSPGRSWDQLRVSVCYSQANVKVIGGHTGLTVGEDGATHQAMEDIALTRVLPNMIVVCPCDVHQARAATHAIAEHVGPAYLRLTRPDTPIMTTSQTPFEIGKAQIFREGRDVTLIGCGPLLYEALIAAEKLAAQGISAEIINLHTIKPLDETTLLDSVNRTGAAVTIEEHQVMGGMGGAVAELFGRELPVPMEMIGMPDHFGESGKPAELLSKYHMTHQNIIQAAKRAIHRKHR